MFALYKSSRNYIIPTLSTSFVVFFSCRLNNSLLVSSLMHSSRAEVKSESIETFSRWTFSSFSSIFTRDLPKVEICDLQAFSDAKCCPKKEKSINVYIINKPARISSRKKLLNNKHVYLNKYASVLC